MISSTPRAMGTLGARLPTILAKGTTHLIRDSGSVISDDRCHSVSILLSVARGAQGRVVEKSSRHGMEK